MPPESLQRFNTMGDVNDTTGTNRIERWHKGIEMAIGWIAPVLSKLVPIVGSGRAFKVSVVLVQNAIDLANDPILVPLGREHVKIVAQ